MNKKILRKHKKAWITNMLTKSINGDQPKLEDKIMIGNGIPYQRVVGFEYSHKIETSHGIKYIFNIYTSAIKNITVTYNDKRKKRKWSIRVILDDTTDIGYKISRADLFDLIYQK